MYKRFLCLYQFFIIFATSKQIMSVQAPMRITGNVLCVDTPETTLKDVLGPAFNSRYMSIQDPRATTPPAANKRTTLGDLPFSVAENYSKILSEDPAWKVDHYQMESRRVLEEGTVLPAEYNVRLSSRRSANKHVWDPQQWQCDWTFEWKDLGPDYFPRYLRNVRCKTKTCWYSHFQCKPRSFTVKILRRRKERCVTASPDTVVGNNGLPLELERSWVWEEHAVSFCCDCVMKNLREKQ